MERVRAALRTRDYEPIRNTADSQDDALDAASGNTGRDGDAAEGDLHASHAMESRDAHFRWPEYAVFLLLGASMLWAWNMFLAAGPYLAQRLEGSEWLRANFQAAELSVSTVGTLLVTLLLTLPSLQPSAGGASDAGAGRRVPGYPARIALALVVNAVALALLAASTEVATGVSASVYFGFVVAIVLATAIATGLFQNGMFAFAAGFGSPSYTQGIMVGQGVAGVLPCVAQIGLVLALSGKADGGDSDASQDEPPPVPSGAALAYFLAAVGISCITIMAFSWLLKRKATDALKAEVHNGSDSTRPSAKAAVPIRVLVRKLWIPALALFFTFAITMTFPVFTQKIVSVTPVKEASRILYPSAFIPLAFLCWNLGDLIGRLLTAYPRIALTHRPLALLILSLARVVWIPLYLLCNINGRGAKIDSDAFYLIIVQLAFGISSGYIGSSCMIGVSSWVNPEEREAAGAFMGLCLVFGLAAGSLLSFLISGV